MAKTVIYMSSSAAAALIHHHHPSLRVEQSGLGPDPVISKWYLAWNGKRDSFLVARPGTDIHEDGDSVVDAATVASLRPGETCVTEEDGRVRLRLNISSGPEGMLHALHEAILRAQACLPRERPEESAASWFAGMP